MKTQIKLTPLQEVARAILCAATVFPEPSFVTWAKRWLTGTDRSGRAALEATAVPTRAVESAAAESAWYAARAAASVALASVSPGELVELWIAPSAKPSSADYAKSATKRAEKAVERARIARPDLDIDTITRQALAVTL